MKSFTLGGAGTLTSVLSLGTGFLSGLAFDSVDGNLYAIADDPIVTGHSFLDKIDLGTSTVSQVLDLGLAFEGGGIFTGGLTFDPNNDKLYALGADINGVSRPFYEIDLGTSTVTHMFDLGDGSLGFNGGVLFDSGSGLFYAISNESNGNSELNSFTLRGGGASEELKYKERKSRTNVLCAVHYLQRV